MDILLSFFIGNLGKFSGHLLFPLEEIEFMTTFPLSCIVVYMISKRRIWAYLAAALGFAGHEYIFSSVGVSMGLVYQQYPWDSFVLSFVFFLILQIIVHGIFVFGRRSFHLIRTRLKKQKP
ncbi:hypothetical protein SAMN05660337_3083 [Maridesulfovibrio ferrireducens]|uniref:Uncharacterized protein n=1 Tax=Maridesulfovibrio ferrireducens TaxID=246191 RepID=A0A1G9KHL9_9BACT|nr:hypothetical protein [Maridesulfovibrio ferrireducens]SDL49096.1 hypothetical protein SAMN05660337_3083 [Maridesulfovibrio ferrireducens]